MNASDHSIISYLHTVKESYKNTLPWLQSLRHKGLKPAVITVDGEKSIIRAIQDTWPQITIQRCLYHIQMEGSRWLRTHPKTQAARELKAILSTLSSIKSFVDRDEFIELFEHWINTYYLSIRKMPNTSIQFKDLKKTARLIHTALPNMFHYLIDPKIPATTNPLEGFFSHLKSDYHRHRGLSKEHRKHYLQWYCYFKNQQKNNTF